jgi:hypothetical protein
MGELKGVRVSGQQDWKLYNIAMDLGENTDVAEQHPDILQKIIAAYDKYSQDVGIIIPASGPLSTLFPQITANNTQTINLTKIFVPGYWEAPQEFSGNETGTLKLIHSNPVWGNLTTS